MDWLTKVRKHFLQKKNLLEKQLKEVKKARDESPSAMESHSDVSRSINERFALAIEEKLESLKKDISLIPDKREDTTNKVALWSYIELVIDGKLMNIFLVPEGMGGDDLEKDVKIISISSPIANQILGKSIKDKDISKEKKINILKIE